MAHLCKSSWSVFPVKQHTLHNMILEIYASLLLFLNVSHVKSLNFNFSAGFLQADPLNAINTTKDSYVDGNGVLQLTKNARNSQISLSVGRASYSQPVFLWGWDSSSSSTKRVTNFTTHFRFNISIDGDRENFFGDGLAFFLAPFDDSTAFPPPNSTGGCLGLVTRDVRGFCNTTSTSNIKYPFVAVEFDTFGNEWDPSNDHLGVDVNSIVSKPEATYLWPTSMKDNATTGSAWITYNSASNNLSIFLTYDDNPVFTGNSSLWYNIDLSTVLPSKVRVGFSASTGENTEINQILSWDFTSTLSDNTTTSTHKPPPAPAPSFISSASVPLNSRSSKVGLLAAILSALGVLTLGVGLFGFMWWQRRSRHLQNDDEMDVNLHEDDDDDFQNGTGPRKFKYSELIRATNNFAEEGKLGQGGFGGVYKGLLTDPTREIAVKKISRESKQGKKEYVSEVRTISRLRHRNLVQLLGWCHDRGELLLVYELMPNGSLDSHLYGGKKVALPWAVRYKIAHGLASSLFYLHEEWEQCVVHRDMKSSNVMLDSNFNAKLGDFGLARLVDHELGSQTTVLAGTLGYLAPECVTTGKASKESDVYSFGVVALEIACGRRPVEPKEEYSKVRMVEWVWDLYGNDLLLEAVDTRLEGEFDIQQIECLMVVGLWCCHPEHTLRPSIRQVLNVLNSEAPLPRLPSKFPVPIYFSPPVNMEVFSIASSSGITGSTSTTDSSSQSNVAPLLSSKANLF